MKKKIISRTMVPHLAGPAFRTMWREAEVLLIVSLLILPCSVLLPVAGEAAAKEPQEIIRHFNESLLQAMKESRSLGFSGRYKLLEPVIRESFHLPFMARKSAGKYWKSLDDGQRAQYLDIFDAWSVAHYAGRFDKYSGETFVILSEKSQGRNALDITTQLVKPEKEPVDFAFRLRKSKDTWHIVDIQIRGISQLAMTRSQFTGILDKDGFNVLLVRMQEKIDALSTKD
jgi:phospholipid transport system substrate-binding protein